MNTASQGQDIFDELWKHLSFDYINIEVLMPHDQARESFRLPAMVVKDPFEFQQVITAYVQHHRAATGSPKTPDALAFSTAKRILDNEFERDPFQEGYVVALDMATRGTDGGLRLVINSLADFIRRTALNEYLDWTYYRFIHPLSKSQALAISRAFFERYGQLLRRHGIDVDETTFAWNTRAAFEYLRRALEQVAGLARKL